MLFKKDFEGVKRLFLIITLQKVTVTLQKVTVTLQKVTVTL